MRALFRLACWAALVASWLLTVACCLSGSICRMGVPALTWSPDFTKILVIWPSTWGLMTAEWRDFRMARYSLESAICWDWTMWTWTGMAWGAGPAGGALFWQAPTKSRADRTSVRAGILFRNEVGVPLPGIFACFYD